MNSLFPTSMKMLDRPLSFGDRVAILTRTKNRPILLARAFASIIAQTHQNWHLYLVNDGGDPAQVNELVETYETAFAGRLTVIHHERSLGMEAASNAGLSIAQGDFIVVHDDDDSWHPEFLEITTKHLNAPSNHKYAAVLTNCYVVNERIENDRVLEQDRTVWSYWQPQVDLATMLTRNISPPICLLVRKAIADLIGPFNATLPVLGDWDYNLRILTVGDIATIPEPLAYYHHRVQTDTGLYGNSVRAGVNQHQLYDTLYRNSLVRPLLQKEPGYIGLLHILLRQADGKHSQTIDLLKQQDTWNHHRHADLQHRITVFAARLDNSEAQLHQINETLAQLRQSALEDRAVILEIHYMLSQLTRLLRGFWRRIVPLRRLIAKMRGRI
ncbi:glycosyl transferase family 2 [Nitrospirillum pindoramense]|uniref:Glycosyl transferase family 2 n=2 Tax=Nitrospirillum amazonense TaxID=28077 RepID=A0A560HDG5_9PROT|nr:glycosyl transferase family 2 [Nitrospirillum amazonense]